MASQDRGFTPQRWQQIKALLERALDEPPADREAFVLANGADDGELCAEVLSLLASHEQARDFLESVRPEPAGNPEDQRDLAGTRVGAYKLVREIGHGGMGSVYLAVRADQEFRKRVAIKLIRRGADNSLAISRFRNERQILARLEHANIARLIDGGTTADGLPYFVMEYVEGEPFLSYCRSRALSIRERVNIFQSVCAAVEYAHQRNIIHRDLKPTNILVKAGGIPKLLDFGIAKFVNSEGSEEAGFTTVAGLRPMTPAYASPEQLRGEPASVRSDIYALGAVLWEVLSGELPHSEESIASFDPARAGMAPQDCDLLLRLGTVIHRAVREDPAERCASVAAFANDLRRVIESQEVPSDAGALPEGTPENSVAVLPFQVLTSEPVAESYLGAAIADAIIIRLSNVGRIVVRPTSSVLRFSPLADAMAVGRELKVHFVLEGRVHKTADHIRVTIQLIAIETGRPVCAVSFDEPAADLLGLEDSISVQVAHAVLPELTREERCELARQGTRSAKAHQAYLRGRWHWNRYSEADLPQALLYFTEAVVEDPQYARAHAGIADYHIALGIWGLLPPKESFAAAIQAARRALEIDPRLAEAQASLGLALWAGGGDHEAAEYHLQMAISLYPGYAPAHDWFGLLKLAHGQAELALASLEGARSLEPASAMFSADLAMCYYTGRRYREAIACFDATASPPPVVSGSILSLALLASNEPNRAHAAALQYVSIMNRSPLALAILAVAEAAVENTAEAQSLLQELTARARDRYVSGIALALAYMACRRYKPAVRELKRAIEEGDWWAVYLEMPVWDPLRGQAAFNRLLKRAARRAPKRVRLWSVAAAAVLLAGLTALVHSRFGRQPSFQGAEITRLTAGGNATSTAISSDGQYVAWTSEINGAMNVWLRNLRSGARRQIAGPFGGMLLSLSFARNNQHVAFIIRPVNDPAAATLYLVPVSEPQRHITVPRVATPLGIAPDESHLAYYRSNGDADELVEADLDASGGKLVSERVIYSRRHPEAFSEYVAPAWSPDGRALAVLVSAPSAGKNGIELLLVGVDGKVRHIDTTPWQKIASVAWAGGSSGLMVAAADPQGVFPQIWYVPTGGGRPRRITSSLDEYSSLNVAAGSAAMVAIQQQTIANLYVFDPARRQGPVQMTAGGGRYSDVTWTPAGAVVYAGDSSGSAEIWTVDRNGGGPRQLTHGFGRSYAPAVSPDGRTIAFHSNRGGVWNVWVVPAGGGEPARVTHDSNQSTWPRFTPDGSALVYQRLGANALYSIWRQPLSGGPARQLTTAHTMYATVSEDGRLAYWYCQNPSDAKWSIAILRPRGEVPERFFSFPPDRMPGVLLRWVPGQDAISYIEDRNGVSNIWIQSLDGSPARQATSFTSGHIYSFDWARDGRLIYSQGATASNVVLIRGSE